MPSLFILGGLDQGEKKRRKERGSKAGQHSLRLPITPSRNLNVLYQHLFVIFLTAAHCRYHSQFHPNQKGRVHTAADTHSSQKGKIRLAPSAGKKRPAAAGAGVTTTAIDRTRQGAATSADCAGLLRYATNTLVLRRTPLKWHRDDDTVDRLSSMELGQHIGVNGDRCFTI